MKNRIKKKLNKRYGFKKYNNPRISIGIQFALNKMFREVYSNTLKRLINKPEPLIWITKSNPPLQT